MLTNFVSNVIGHYIVSELSGYRKMGPGDRQFYCLEESTPVSSKPFLSKVCWNFSKQLKGTLLTTCSVLNLAQEGVR